MDPDRQQKAWDRAARLLTEGEGSSSVAERQKIVAHVTVIFEYSGYPDWWARVQRLEDDTEMMKGIRNE
jgi:hypothetical protein